MKWLRASVLVIVLGSACTAIAPEDDFFDGDGSGGSGTSGGTGTTSGGSKSDPTSGGSTSSGGDGVGGEAGASFGGSAGSGGATGGGGSAGDGTSSGGSSRGGSGGASKGGNGGTGAISAGGAAGAAGAGGECNLPATKTESGPCGACNTGMRTRTLTLDDNCAYVAGTWSACAGEVANPCMASQMETGTQACGACNTGKQTRSRTCNPMTCTWDPWGAWSACGGVTAACTPGATTACANGDSCGQRVCSSTCTWGGCTPKVSGGCLRIREGHTDEGSNFRCCATGKWQFCLSSCQWSTACASCSQGSPDYCTECY